MSAYELPFFLTSKFWIVIAAENVRPNLRASIWDHGESDSIIVKAHPCDLFEGRQGSHELCISSDRSLERPENVVLTRERADVLQLRLEPHIGEATARVEIHMRLLEVITTNRVALLIEEPTRRSVKKSVVLDRHAL